MSSEKKLFISYVRDFYNIHTGVYKNVFKEPITLDEVASAYNYLSSVKDWCGGDSVDRERARDFILLSRCEEPVGHIYNPIVKNVGIEDLLEHFKKN